MIDSLGITQCGTSLCNQFYKTVEIMRTVFRFLRERRKLVFVCTVIYIICFHVVYTHYWRRTPTGTAVIDGADSRQSSMSASASLEDQRKSRVGQGGEDIGIISSLWKFRLPDFVSKIVNARSDDDDDPESIFDIHLEDSILGHTGEVTGGAEHHTSTATDGHSLRVGNETEVIIAIGGGITSRGVKDVDASSDFVAKFQFFNTFLQTFCETACANFTYRFYLAYDHVDPVFANLEIAAGFHRTFAAETKKMCLGPRGIRTSLHLVQCSHTGKPTWAQNDAMLEAYIDHVDYFYRINDDTRMTTGGWAEAFVQVLDGYNPPRVGVVGPNHSGGNTAILTYDFVHRTHVDVFGLYYPRLFTDWWGDDWVTMVYRPDRSTKLQHIHLQHTLGLGQRYQTHHEVGGKLHGQLDHDHPIVNRYIAAVRARNVSGVLSTSSDGRRVIAMTLFGRDPRHTWGVLRNAQLVPVFFPGWRLRVYVPSNNVDSPDMVVPPRLINKLRLLGADVARVGGRVGNSSTSTGGFRWRDWRLLVADDRKVDFFLIRDSESRLNDRDASAVNEWIAEVERSRAAGDVDAFPVHCIRDHPKHANRAVVDGLWGGRPSVLRRRLGSRLTTALYRKSSTSTVVSNVTGSDVNNTSQLLQPKSTLEEVLWPIVVGDKAAVLSHDVVSACDRWTATTTKSKRLPFPVARLGNGYVGQRYDEHQELASGDDSGKLGPDVICSTITTSPGPAPFISGLPSHMSVPTVPT